MGKIRQKIERVRINKEKHVIGFINKAALIQQSGRSLRAFSKKLERGGGLEPQSNPL